MNKRDLKKLTKAHPIRLLLKQEKNRQAQKPSNSIKQMVNEYKDILQPPQQFRIGKWKNVKPKPVP